MVELSASMENIQGCVQDTTRRGDFFVQVETNLLQEEIEDHYVRD